MAPLHLFPLLCVLLLAPPLSVSAQIIFDAVLDDDAAAIKECISRGEPINMRGRGGQTPLMNAVFSGKAKAVRALLDAGADCTVPEKGDKLKLNRWCAR